MQDSRLCLVSLSWLPVDSKIRILILSQLLHKTVAHVSFASGKGAASFNTRRTLSKFLALLTEILSFWSNAHSIGLRSTVLPELESSATRETKHRSRRTICFVSTREAMRPGSFREDNCVWVLEYRNRKTSGGEKHCSDLESQQSSSAAGNVRQHENVVS